MCNAEQSLSVYRNWSIVRFISLCDRYLSKNGHILFDDNNV